jgi:OOP family OmpA-OmpF porin
MKKIITAVALVAASLSAQAQAQSQGFYIGGGVGISGITDTSQEINALLVSQFGGSASTTMDKTVNNVRLLGGYKINENIAVEVGYLNAASFNFSTAGTTSGRVAYTVSGDVSFSGFDVAAVIRPSVSSGYNSFFATAGLHSYESKASSAFIGGGLNIPSITKNSGTGTMFGVGYDLKIDKEIDLRLAFLRVNKLAGESEDSLNNFSVSIIKHF